ncbi:MAG: TonB-dependent receptor, partial [Bacteroides sp.]|nr:TonB-dependent receptor [Bacteroides sp.]
WVPVTSKIKPMQAHQYSIGAYYNGLPGWEFSIESYYKQMRNVLEYKEGVSFLGSSTNWEDKVEMGKGRSMGIEFMAQKLTGKTTGWIAYTLARSDRQFAKGGINNGERFPYKYDRRHNISLSLNHKFSDRIDVGATWVFYTGGTATIPVGVTGALRPDGDMVKEEKLVTQRNNYRLPGSHRLNLGINFNKKTRHGVRTWNISVYNAYNAMNPTLLLYKDNIHKMKKLTLLPCIPSVTYTYKF